jgi:hypothetical protein
MANLNYLSTKWELSDSQWHVDILASSSWTKLQGIIMDVAEFSLW